MNKDSQHKSTEAQQWPPISFEKHVWQQDGNQDATERIEEDVVKGESKGPFAKAVEGSGDSGSSSLGLNRSTEMEYQAALPLLIAERSVAVPGRSVSSHQRTARRDGALRCGVGAACG